MALVAIGHVAGRPPGAHGVTTMGTANTRAPKTRILLADDNEIVLAVLMQAAQARGHQVSSATTGAATIAMALETQPDLIVLDMQFPDADGRDVLARLKSDQRTAHIPVVVWSGRKGHDSDRRISLELGAEDYVEKNRAEFLVGKLERVLLRLEQVREAKRRASDTLHV
jgi:two-component system, OmpR family, alkaline phosphatase synthesis response regulator PhoP